MHTLIYYPFILAGHDYKSPTTFPFGIFLNDPEYIVSREPFMNEEYRSISIGNDVWIGTNVTIMYNLTIGDGAVIGAYTVLREDVPPYAIVTGNPQRIVKYRFSQDVINSFMKIQWY
jgi:acetyltransferase-like isoleucine patch superfamily enzyme